MNFLDYLVNAMSGGQPSAQELEMRKMAQQGLLSQQAKPILEPMQQPAQMSPSAPMSPYMQGLTNPGMTMQKNYVDPRLIEQMYYRGLLSR
jgi:hypothetical protein